MSRYSFDRAALAAIAVMLATGPALAEGGPGYGAGYHRHAPARPLPPEIRYRDPRFLPPRRAPRLLAPPPGGPVDLIEAYLPRFTNAPMYNEPPSRFPQR